MTTLFAKICYFVTVYICTHDYTNQFNMKWKKNQFEGRKVVRFGTKSGRATARHAQ